MILLSHTGLKLCSLTEMHINSIRIGNISMMRTINAFIGEELKIITMIRN